MSRIIRCALTQTHHDINGNEPVQKHKDSAIQKYIKLIEEAASKGVQIICFEELFFCPYFCAEQNTKWYSAAERIPEGATIKLMQEQAKKYKMVIIVPMFEEDITGVYYNTAAVIDADGSYLGKYRKTHIPHESACGSYGFWEKYYFRPGNSDWPIFETSYAKIGVFICYDRYFPECARILGLKGAEILFNPSSTSPASGATKTNSELIWKLEQPAMAVSNALFIGANNRVGMEAPWNIGEFYGTSYFCNPKGEIIIQGSQDKDELITADLNMDMIRQVREERPIYRDFRPEMYHFNY